MSVSLEVPQSFRRFRWLVSCVLIACLGAAPVRAQDGGLEDELSRLLQLGKADVVNGCPPDVDALGRVLCTGKLRVGMRVGYAPFSYSEAGVLKGIEPELAQIIGSRIGVSVEPTIASPASRLAILGDGKVDVLLATLGHTTSRDGQASFVRPHYYSSRSVVIGPAESAVDAPERLQGETACVTTGNWTNQLLAQNHVRLVLVNAPVDLIEFMRLKVCRYGMQDDVVLSPFLQSDEFRGKLVEYFGFSAVPWGMATRISDGARLNRVLSIVLAILHRDDVLAQLGRKFSVPLSFLDEQKTLWSGKGCNSVEGLKSDNCILGPANSTVSPTTFRPFVDRVKDWVEATTGYKLSLPMFETQVAYEMLIKGVYITASLVVGCALATLLFMVMFAAAVSSRIRLVRAVGKATVALAMGCPVLLLVIFANLITMAILPPDFVLRLMSSMVAIGIYNGAFAGAAVADAIKTASVQGRVSIKAGVIAAWSEVTAFLINSAKGIPNASVIGIPEMAGALNDIASISTDRVSLYVLLLLSYVILVSIVVAVAGYFKKKFTTGVV